MQEAFFAATLRRCGTEPVFIHEVVVEEAGHNLRNARPFEAGVIGDFDARNWLSLADLIENQYLVHIAEGLMRSSPGFLKIDLFHSNVQSQQSVVDRLVDGVRNLT